jgi:hypothetical protein
MQSGVICPSRWNWASCAFCGPPGPKVGGFRRLAAPASYAANCNGPGRGSLKITGENRHLALKAMHRGAG